MADLVLWQPMFFGVKPEMIIKGGQVSWSQSGIGVYADVRPEPVCLRKKFGAVGRSPNANSVVFVSKVNIAPLSNHTERNSISFRLALN